MYLSTYFGFAGLALGVMGLATYRAGDHDGARHLVVIGAICAVVAAVLAIGARS